MLRPAKIATFFCMICALAPPASADEGHGLAVVRGTGAEHCPDGRELDERIRALRGEAKADTAGGFEVDFARDEGGLSASIRARGSRSARVLRDAGPSCSALAQATAVTLALLFDSSAAEPAPAAPAPATPPPRPPQADEHAPARKSPRSSRTSATLSLGGGALAGVIAPVVPAWFGEVGVELSRFRTSVGALFVLSHSTELGPGSVRQSLVTGLARSCLSPFTTSSLRFDVCSGIYAGVLTGQGSGYTENERAKTPWLALPLELAWHGVSSDFGWELGLAALVPVRRHDFAIDGVGVAYESPAVAGLLSLRAVALWAL